MTHLRGRNGSLAAILAVAVGITATSGAHGTATASCHHRKRAVVITLHDAPHILKHARQAVRDGQPAVWHIDRADADEHRDESLSGILSWGQLTPAQRRKADPDHPKARHDRDEYPPAASREGGRGADVEYVLSSENRSAGAQMGAALSGWCDGQAARYRGVR